MTQQEVTFCRTISIPFGNTDGSLGCALRHKEKGILLEIIWVESREGQEGWQDLCSSSWATVSP